MEFYCEKSLEGLIFDEYVPPLVCKPSTIFSNSERRKRLVNKNEGLFLFISYEKRVYSLKSNKINMLYWQISHKNETGWHNKSGAVAMQEARTVSWCCWILLSIEHNQMTQLLSIMWFYKCQHVPSFYVNDTIFWV